MAKLTTSDLTTLTNETSAVATINANNALIETAMENTLSRDGTTPNTMSADIDLNGNDLLNIGSLGTSGGGTILDQAGYAEEWASKAENSLVSTAAGGNGTTEYSSLHWAAKAAADLVLTNADVVSTNADVVSTNADVVLTNADVVTAGTSEANAAASASAAAASAAGIFWKEPAVNATTANITLSGEQTIDGILTSTSRILVKNQTASEDNGVYVTAAGAWARATPLDTWDEHIGAAVIVSSGLVHGDSAWICTVDAGGTLGTTPIAFTGLSQVYTSATASSEGIIELATQAEVDAGTDATRAVTADTLYDSTDIIGPTNVYGTVNAQTGTTYTAVLLDDHKVITCSNASAIAFTVPTNASVAFPVGAKLSIAMIGAGVVTITGDTGVYINGISAGSGDLAQYGACDLVKLATDTWLAVGLTVA